MLKFSGSSDIKKYVKNYIEQLNLKEKRVIDVPAGKGITSCFLHKAGACVKAYDLFPEVYENEEVTCHEADLMSGLPESSESADIIICQEGIEHLPNQLAALQEFNRILRPNGILVITTPSISHLRARVSNLLTESELYTRMPPNELDALWYAKNGKMYFGHIFLIGIQRLRVLAVASGFRLKKIHPVKVSNGSLLFLPIYPIIALVNLWSYIKNIYRKDGIDRETKRRVYGEQLKINLHPSLLFGRHLFIEFEKNNELGSTNVTVTKPRY